MTTDDVNHNDHIAEHAQLLHAYRAETIVARSRTADYEVFLTDAERAELAVLDSELFLVRKRRRLQRIRIAELDSELFDVRAELIQVRAAITTVINENSAVLRRSLHSYVRTCNHH